MTTATKLPRISSTSNKDGSMTLYVNGKKDMRGTALEVCVRIEELRPMGGTIGARIASTVDQLLTAASHKLFCDLANDADNWNGEPMLGGNVGSDAALRGNIADLKKKGLIRTFRDEGCTFVQFTDAGKAHAAALGINL
jgi:hypothetical protein